MATDNRHWFLLNMAHANYARLIVDAEKRHKEIWPRNELSIVLSDDGTQSLVKVSGATTTWRAANSVDRTGPLVLDIYNERDHHRALTLLAGAEWSKTREIAA